MNPSVSAPRALALAVALVVLALALVVLPGAPAVVEPAAAAAPQTEAPDLVGVGNFRAGPDNDDGDPQTLVDFTFDAPAHLNGGDHSNFHLVPTDAGDALDGRGIRPEDDAPGDEVVTVLFTGDLDDGDYARGYVDTGIVNDDAAGTSADSPGNINQSEPISGDGATANPDLVSVTKDGDQVLFAFDQDLTADDVIQNTAGLRLYFPDTDQSANIPDVGASVVVVEDASTLRATFGELPEDHTLDDAVGGVVAQGAVQAVPGEGGGNDGANAFQDVAPVDDTGKVVCAAAPEAGQAGDGDGPTSAPDLVAVGNFRPGPTTAQGTRTTCVDFVFDQPATIVNGTTSSFALVPLDASDAMSGTTNVAAPNDQDDDRVVTIPFDGVLDPADVARGHVDAEVVSSDPQGATGDDPANSSQAEDVSPGTATDNPDLASITVDGDQVLFAFDQALTSDDVAQNSSGLRLYFPEPVGSNALIPFAGSSLVQVEDDTTLRATYNDLPGDYTLDDAVGGYVVQGSVQAAPGEGGGNDGNNAFDELAPLDDTGAEVCAAAPETGESGDGSGPTVAPDLLAVGNFRRGPVTTQGGATTCVDFLFDQVAWLNGGDVSNFGLVPGDADDALSGTTNVQLSNDEEGDRVVTVAFPGDLDPADVARGFVDSEVVNSAEEGVTSDDPANVNQSEDVDPETASANPDLVGAERSGDSYLFRFDQDLTDDDVIQNSSGLRLYFPDAAGGSTVAVAPSSRVERVDARTLRATYVDLPGDQTLADAVGAFVVQGTVQAVQGERGGNDGTNGFHEIDRTAPTTATVTLGASFTSGRDGDRVELAISSTDDDATSSEAAAPASAPTLTRVGAAPGRSGTVPGERRVLASQQQAGTVLARGTATAGGEVEPAVAEVELGTTVELAVAFTSGSPDDYEVALRCSGDDVAVDGLSATYAVSAASGPVDCSFATTLVDDDDGGQASDGGAGDDEGDGGAGDNEGSDDEGSDDGDSDDGDSDDGDSDDGDSDGEVDRDTGEDEGDDEDGAGGADADDDLYPGALPRTGVPAWLVLVAVVLLAAGFSLLEVGRRAGRDGPR